MSTLTKLSPDNFEIIAGFLGEAHNFGSTSKEYRQCAEEILYPVIYKQIVAEPLLAHYLPDNLASLPSDAARVRAIYKRFMQKMHALAML